MTKYTKRLTDFFYCPKLPEGNFLNSSAGVIQALEQDDIIAYCLVTDDLLLVLPKRQDEGSSGVGEGVNETVVLESQFTIGAGNIVNQAINFLMIPRIGGDYVSTYSTTELFVITCVADVNKSLLDKYFEFDIQLDDFSIKKYFVWFNVNAEGVAPTPAVPYGGARTAVEITVATNATANTIAADVHTAINALTDVSSVNTGSPSAIVTVTCDNAGGVDDAHDVDSGVTISITTQGGTIITAIYDAESFEQQNFGFQPQRDKGIVDTIYTLTGCTIAEHTLACEHDGDKMTEDISYMVAGLKEQYGDLSASLLAKMRNPYGVQWTKGLSPYGNKSEVKNHNWATVNKNFTLTYGAALDVTWFGFKVAIENLMTHDRDGGGKFASAVDFNKRNCTIGINVQNEDYILLQLSRLHWTEYANDLVIQIKSAQAGDANVFVQFDCSKCRVMPFDEVINADGSAEKYEVDLKPCPGSEFKYTIGTYLSNEYFGGHKGA